MVIIQAKNITDISPDIVPYIASWAFVISCTDRDGTTGVQFITSMFNSATRNNVYKRTLASNVWEDWNIINPS